MKIMNKTKHLTFLLCILFTFPSWAQREKGKMSHQRLSAIKMNFIAEKIECSIEKEAQFWAVYQKYETELHQEYYQKIRTVRKQYIDRLDEIKEGPAAKVLQELAELRDSKERIRRELETELKNFLTAKQRLQLYVAEDAFHRNMMKKRKDH